MQQSRPIVEDLKGFLAGLVAEEKRIAVAILLKFKLSVNSITNRFKFPHFVLYLSGKKKNSENN